MKITRKMWVLMDKGDPMGAQLFSALDGGLTATRPIPAFSWLKPVRVVVTIQEVKAQAKP